jgi:type II secretory pathway pseudopilin PulG
MKRNLRTGQVGLLLLVIMGIVIALVMSLASRSLSDTVLSRQERESGSALTVAETGVESALNELRTNPNPGSGNITDSTGTFTGSFQVANTSTYGLYVREGEMAYLDLSGFLGGNLSISWTKVTDKSENLACSGEGSGQAPAAIEVDAMQGATTSTRSYYNPYGCNAVSGNNFVASTSGGTDYLSTIAAYAVPAGTTAIGIRPIYAGATISVAGAGLITQMHIIQSSAKGGDAQSQVQVKRGLDGPPSIFDFAVFAGGTIVK